MSFFTPFQMIKPCCSKTTSSGEETQTDTPGSLKSQTQHLHPCSLLPCLKLNLLVHREWGRRPRAIHFIPCAYFNSSHLPGTGPGARLQGEAGKSFPLPRYSLHSRGRHGPAKLRSHGSGEHPVFHPHGNPLSPLHLPPSPTLCHPSLGLALPPHTPHRTGLCLQLCVSPTKKQPFQDGRWGLPPLHLAYFNHICETQ